MCLIITFGFNLKMLGIDKSNFSTLSFFLYYFVSLFLFSDGYDWICHQHHRPQITTENITGAFCVLRCFQRARSHIFPHIFSGKRAVGDGVKNKFGGRCPPHTDPCYVPHWSCIGLMSEYEYRVINLFFFSLLLFVGGAFIETVQWLNQSKCISAMHIESKV